MLQNKHVNPCLCSLLTATSYRLDFPSDVDHWILSNWIGPNVDLLFYDAYFYNSSISVSLLVPFLNVSSTKVRRIIQNNRIQDEHFLTNQHSISLISHYYKKMCISLNKRFPLPTQKSRYLVFKIKTMALRNIFQLPIYYLEQ